MISKKQAIDDRNMACSKTIIDLENVIDRQIKVWTGNPFVVKMDVVPGVTEYVIQRIIEMYTSAGWTVVRTTATSGSQWDPYQVTALRFA